MIYRLANSSRMFIPKSILEGNTPKRWILGVLEVPGVLNGSEQFSGQSTPGCPLPQVAKTQYDLNREVVTIRVFVPAATWMLGTHPYGITTVSLGIGRIWDEDLAFTYFEAVCVMAGEFGLTEDPQIANAIRIWFLNRMASLATSMNQFAFAETPNGEIGLQSLLINPNNGRVYAQMGDRYVSPSGEEAYIPNFDDLVSITLPEGR